MSTTCAASQMMSAIRWIAVTLLLAVGAIFPQLAVGNEMGDDGIVSLRGLTMGTTYSVRCWSADGEANRNALQRDVDELLSRFDKQMSTYRDDSELSRFNRAPANEWFETSKDTAYVVRKAIVYHRLTGGASDVTVAPIARLWHFGPTIKGDINSKSSPSDAQIRAALQRVGANRLQVRTNSPALRKDVAGMEVDLSSLAPGYAVDLMVTLLEQRGLENAVVEIGGEVRAAGRRPDGKLWKVGVESPGSDNPGLARVVPLDNLAMATSGDYRNYRTADRQRYAHIIDPRTGRPLPYRGAAVTVVAETCLEADALGTALMVMGDTAGYDWCIQNRVAALMQHRAEDGTLVARSTPRFDELIPAP